MPSNSVCMQTCADGTRIPETQNCSEPNEQSGVCRDGRPVPADGLCRRRCPDGSQVPETQSCTACPGGMIWNPSSRRCVPTTTTQPACPGGMIGTQPGDCRCPETTSWDPRLQRCLPRQTGIFGAIAYSRETHATGYSVNMSSPEAAAERALQECGPRCRVVQRFSNACAALAVGRRGWGTSRTFDRREAAMRAIDNCSGFTPGCTIKVSVCSGR